VKQLSSAAVQHYTSSTANCSVRNWNWPKRTGESDVEIFENLHRDSNFKQEAKLSLGWPTVLPHSTVICDVTWPFDSPHAISCWWSFGMESLNPAVFEIFCSKRIAVTSLTFQCHVTSSVTWPFDGPYAISYWWSFGTKPRPISL